MFALAPALRAGSPLPALLYGALFGLLAYATYDLTNHATLKTWTLKITAIDIVYGAIVVSAFSELTFYVLHWFGSSAG